MALTGVLVVGEGSPLGGGIDPRFVAHLHEGGLARFLAYELDGDDRAGDPGAGSGPADFVRVPGAYAPDLGAEPAYPVTDLLLALAPDLSSAGDRLEALSVKAAANYGVSVREKVFASETAPGSAGYGRHFEARSQLEAHPYEGRIALSLLPGASGVARRAMATNLDRLDAPIDRLS